MKKLFLLIVAIHSSYTWAVTSFSIDQNSSSVEFLAIGRPSALKNRGTKGHPEGKLTFEGKTLKGELTLNLADFETGIAMRDRHMKEKYLEVEKNDFKFTKLKINSIEFPDNFWKSPVKQKTSFKGLLKLHGVEKTIDGEIDFSEASKTALGGVARFTVLLTDFRLSIPSFSVIIVS